LRKLLFSLILGYSIIATAYGQEPVDSARYLYNEYKLASSLGDFLRSQILLKRILDGDYQLSNRQIATLRNSLGLAYYETSRLDDAYDQYRIAEDLVSAKDPGSLELRISIHINLGLLYGGLGDYTNALEYNNEAFRLLSSIPSWNEESFNDLSALLLNKGIALFQLERYEEAKEVLNECAEIKKKRNHPYLGSVYFNLARVYQVLGEHDLSQENYLKGIEQWTSEYDSDYYQLANIYLHLGQFHIARKQPEEGFECLQKALQNYKQNYGPLHPLTAACYESLARYSLEQKEYKQALAYLAEALRSIENVGHDLTLIEILATKTIAQERLAGNETSSQEKTKYLQAALATNSLSVEVLQRIQQAFLSAESRILMISRQKDLFSTGIRLNLSMFKLTGSEDYIEEAFLMATKGKSGELLFEMNSKEWLYLESLSDTMAITASELKQQIDHLSNQIQTETMALSPDSAQLEAWQNQLFHTRDSFSRHMEVLRRDFPQIGHFELDNKSFSLNQIQGRLRRNETLVEYFMTGAESNDMDQLYIFVVSKYECQFYQSNVNPVFHQNLETIIDKLHDFVPYLETKERFDSLNSAFFGMYQDLIQPLESMIRGKDLLIVPDEVLSYVPFDALITQQNTDTIANYAGISYLLEDYNISYLYNSQLIKHKRPWHWNFPDLMAWIPEQSGEVDHSFGKLKGAEEEVLDILELVNGSSTQQSLEKPELISLLQENSILHLAMHSLATESTGKSPYFILDAKTDSLLANRMHDYEINALNLSSPMVVLSSCETAGGNLHSGEGIMSLSRSFLQAGASSVVHTLWPVDDAKSRELMVAYYRELKKGHPKSRALSNVKKQYISQNPPFYTHPYYWAAFQITGDSSPLDSKRKTSVIIGSFLIALLVSFYFKRRSFFRRV